MRAADPAGLITVGYSDPLLAGLPANKTLDIIAINRYPWDASPRQLDFQLTIGRGLQAAFSGKPVFLSEFGYPTSELDPAQAAICEGAAWLRAYEMGLAGAGKWMLWICRPARTRERSFGLYAASGEPKPSAVALPALSARLVSGQAPRGGVEVSASPTGSIVYTYTAADAYFGSGHGRVGADDAVGRVGAGARSSLIGRSRASYTYRPPRPARSRWICAKCWACASSDYTLEAAGAPWEHARAGSILVFPVTAGAPVTLRVPITSIDAKIAIVWPHDDAAGCGGRAGKPDRLPYALRQPGERGVRLRLAGNAVAGAEQRAGRAGGAWHVAVWQTSKAGVYRSGISMTLM